MSSTVSGPKMAVFESMVESKLVGFSQVQYIIIYGQTRVLPSIFMRPGVTVMRQANQHKLCSLRPWADAGRNSLL